jgi:hypothetical protein
MRIPLTLNNERIPFDLSRALAGHALVTRKGEAVTDFHENPIVISGYSEKYPYTARMSDGDFFDFTPEGSYFTKETVQTSDYDLFMAEAPAEVAATPEPVLIPFDLYAALAGAKLVTRDGQEVTEFGYVKTGSETLRYGAYVDGLYELYTVRGRWVGDKAEDGLDLFMGDEDAPSPLRDFEVDVELDFADEEILHGDATDSMTLRDAFAIAAVPSLLRNIYDNSRVDPLLRFASQEDIAQGAAALAYVLADAMLEEREN